MKEGFLAASVVLLLTLAITPHAEAKVDFGLGVKGGVCWPNVKSDLARALIGAEVLLPRAALPEPAAGEHYWDGLEGMRVVSVGGVELGGVSHLFETGANDVMVVKGERERLLPYIPGVIVAVDAERRTIRVDWDPEF